MKISVAMCTYNGARYLSEQLDSIATQTRPPDELVICDDNSADATCEIVSSFASSAPFPVRFHLNEQNLGSTKNFERAIAFCEGEVIVLSDQDDVWLPHKLKEIQRCFSRTPSVGLVFSDAEVVDEQLRPLGYRLWESVGFDDTHRRLVRAGRALDVLLAGWTVTGATMAFRSNFRELVLPIPDNLPMIHDGWLALVIAAVTDVAYIEEPLVRYRQHPDQQIGAPHADSGVRKESGKGMNSFNAALKRQNVYLHLIDIGNELRQRLLEKGNGHQVQRALCHIERRVKHLRARANLPERRFSRVPTIVRELLTLRYHQYSKGIQSAAKDIIS